MSREVQQWLFAGIIALAALGGWAILDSIPPAELNPALTVGCGDVIAKGDTARVLYRSDNGDCGRAVYAAAERMGCTAEQVRWTLGTGETVDCGAVLFTVNVPAPGLIESVFTVD